MSANLYNVKISVIFRLSRWEGTTARSHLKRHKTYHHGDLRRALVDAALRIVHSKGISGLTMRAVAREAHVSHMAPYHHFADKSALVAAVAAEGFRGLKRETETRIAEGPDDLRAQFRESGVAYVVFAVKNPNLFKVMFGAELADSTAYPDLHESATSVSRLVLDLVEQIQSGKSTSGADSHHIGLTAWALVHGLAVLCIDGQFGAEAAKPAGAERLAYQATGSVFRGLPGN